MPDLYAGLPALWRRRLMLVSSSLSILILLIFGRLGAPLTTPAAPWGMISYQLARTPGHAHAILASWDAAAQVIAAFCLGLDYLFMPVYALAISLAARWVGLELRQRGQLLAPAGILLAWGVWLAALLDALENAALSAWLFGYTLSPLPGLTWGVAIVKYTLVMIALIYVCSGLLLIAIKPGPPPVQA